MRAMRKNIPGLLLFISLCVHVRFVPATTVIVDTTGLDFQYYWYTGTLGQQIAVDSSGKVHVCYTKTWVTASDTGYQVMYANVSDGIKIPIPSQEPWADIQPGVVYLDGGHHGTPIYLYYGVGSSFYGYRAKMHLQALAKLSDDCKRIVPLGLQDDFNGYHEVFIIPYANPIELEVDYLNGIVHCINTNPSGSEVIYWNFDGTNFSIRYFMLNADTDNGYCGKYVPSRFRRNGTRGADLTISVNGEEVTIATLHPACNILLHKGILKGSVWADNFFKGLADGSVVALYDTTNSATVKIFPTITQNRLPKSRSATTSIIICMSFMKPRISIRTLTPALHVLISNGGGGTIFMAVVAIQMPCFMTVASIQSLSFVIGMILPRRIHWLQNVIIRWLERYTNGFLTASRTAALRHGANTSMTARLPMLSFW